ncbi:MAG TPA: hypothetical protein VLO11_02975 [Luteolibacter sp.]|nr:hypothetical protein [Luteolibacter sp.]
MISRRAVDEKEWCKTLADWKKSAQATLKGHPWEKQSSSDIVDDLRGDPADSFPGKGHDHRHRLHGAVGDHPETGTSTP